MTETYSNFIELGRNIRPTAPEVTNAENVVDFFDTILGTVHRNEGCSDEDRDSIDSILVGIHAIDWRNKNQTSSGANDLKMEAVYLQEVLKLEESPLPELTDFSDGYWTNSNATPLSEALNRHHSNMLKGYLVKNPNKKAAVELVGSAAHWTARNDGATWQEAVNMSRYAQELYCKPYSMPYNDSIYDMYTAMKGLK